MNRTEYLLRELRYSLDGVDWRGWGKALAVTLGIVVGVRALCLLMGAAIRAWY